MANTNKNDVATLLQPGLNTLFLEFYNKTESKALYKKIATVITSQSDTENYSWLNESPGVREFIGEREIKSLSENTYSLKNKTWEATLGIEREVLEDDKYGQIKIRVEELATSVSRHKNKLCFETLVKGADEKCFDGQNFFSSSHTYTGKGVYSALQSNLGSLTLSEENLKTSISNMGKIKSSQGEPLNIVPDTIVVPPDLEWTAKELTLSSSIGESHSLNPLKGMLEVIVSPYITDSDSWYLLCCKGVLKPIILQERSAVEFTALGGDSEEGFMRDLFLFGVRGRYNAGFSYWQMAYANIP